MKLSEAYTAVIHDLLERRYVKDYAMLQELFRAQLNAECDERLTEADHAES